VKRSLATVALVCALLLGAVAAPALSSRSWRAKPVDFSMVPPAGALLGQASARGAGVVSQPLRAPKRFNLVGLTWTELGAQPRIAVRTRTDGAGVVFTERTNVANSVHQGLESYLETTPLVAPEGLGTLTIFNSLALTDAHYTTGDVKGRRVEYAPKVVERVGITLARGPVATTFLTSHTSSSFGDADNTVRSEDAVVGVIPAYTVLDLSATVTFPRGWRLQGGVNNVADRRYFTRRTDEYPGPGILPSLGRSVYVTVRAAP